MTTTNPAMALGAVAAILVASGCTVGPKYRKPDVPALPAFKEPLPEGWKQAEPGDDKIPGKWWEISSAHSKLLHPTCLSGRKCRFA